MICPKTNICIYFSAQNLLTTSAPVSFLLTRILNINCLRSQQTPEKVKNFFCRRKKQVTGCLRSLQPRPKSHYSCLPWRTSPAPFFGEISRTIDLAERVWAKYSEQKKSRRWNNLIRFCWIFWHPFVERLKKQKLSETMILRRDWIQLMLLLLPLLLMLLLMLLLLLLLLLLLMLLLLLLLLLSTLWWCRLKFLSVISKWKYLVITSEKKMHWLPGNVHLLNEHVLTLSTW